MGRGIVESGLFRTERVGLEVRTTDPETAYEGEVWIRSDIAPDTDQIATLRFDRGGSAVDVPIYNDAASFSDGTKAFRVQVGSVTGFVPFIENGGENDFLRLQHNSTWWGANDSLSVIPDSVVNNLDVWYPINAGSGSPTDQIKGNTITLSGTTWNGTTFIYQDYSLDHDGTDDESIEDQTTNITGGVSVCGWFYPHDLSTPSDPFAIKDNPTNPTYFVRLQQFNGDSIRFMVQEGDSVSATVTGLSNNQFYFIAGTAESDGSGGSIVNTYVWDTAAQVGTNSLTDTPADYAGNVAPAADTFATSRDENSRYYNGLTDAFGYNAGTVLTESNFEAIWNDTKP